MNKTLRNHCSCLLTVFLVLTVAFSLTALTAQQISAATFQEAPPVEEQEQEQEQEKAKDLKKNNTQEKKSEEQKGTSDKDKSAKPKESVDGKSDKPQEETGTGDKQTGSSPSNRRRRQSRSTSNSRAGNSFLNVFRPAIANAARATVEIKSNKETLALGAVVDSSGYVLTKQSELRSPLTCELSDGRSVAAQVYGVHPDTDLALLKIEADNLTVVQWANTDTLGVGHWLVTVKDSEMPLGVGVVGVKARLIRPESGFMGVNLRQTERGVQLLAVTPESPAEKAGLRPGDIILKVNDESFTDIDKLIPRVKSYPPGEEIRLTLKRDEREIIADVVLGEERSLNPLYERSNQQNTMGGNVLSKRRQNFPMAVQHDTFLKPEECGGPVVNIDGEVVGINIARQGRVSSLMLPSSLVRTIVDELKSGQWAPAVVHKERIDEITRKLQELNTEVALSPMNNDTLKKKVSQLNKDEEKLREKLEKIFKERVRAEVELEQSSETLEAAQKEIERLKQEREELVTGIR